MSNQVEKNLCPFTKDDCAGDKCALWRGKNPKTEDYNGQCGVALLIEDVRALRMRYAPETLDSIVKKYHQN